LNLLEVISVGLLWPGYDLASGENQVTFNTNWLINRHTLLIGFYIEREKSIWFIIETWPAIKFSKFFYDYAMVLSLLKIFRRRNSTFSVTDMWFVEFDCDTKCHVSVTQILWLKFLKNHPKNGSSGMERWTFEVTIDCTYNIITCWIKRFSKKKKGTKTKGVAI